FLGGATASLDSPKLARGTNSSEGPKARKAKETKRAKGAKGSTSSASGPTDLEDVVDHEFAIPTGGVTYRDVTIVDASEPKRLDIRVQVPIEDMARLGQVGQAGRVGRVK